MSKKSDLFKERQNMAPQRSGVQTNVIKKIDFEKRRGQEETVDKLMQMVEKTQAKQGEER